MERELGEGAERRSREGAWRKSLELGAGSWELGAWRGSWELGEGAGR